MVEKERSFFVCLFLSFAGLIKLSQLSRLCARHGPMEIRPQGRRLSQSKDGRAEKGSTQPPENH